MGVSFAFMAGRVVIEGMSAIRDMGYTFKNNRLETVANHILGEGKLIHDEEDKLGEIERQFVEEKENLAKYNPSFRLYQTKHLFFDQKTKLIQG